MADAPRYPDTDPAATADHPFTSVVRVGLVAAGLALIAAGVSALFLRDADTGAAALVTLGVGIGVLALIGPYVESFRYAGVEATFRVKHARAALYEALVARKVVGDSVTAAEQSGALRRAASHAALLGSARVLWVDDHPGGNDPERRMLTSFGVTVDLALDNEDALPKLWRRYDCIISDIARPTGRPSGLDLVPAVEASPNRWLIFYITDLDPGLGVPVGALGITDRPDHLLHLVLDAVEREHFEADQT